jgi:predicted RNase H-like HicB family nuclease
VQAVWDPEAGVFVATSDDVPGLVAEAATPTELDAKLQVLIPELLELNGPTVQFGGVTPNEVVVLVQSDQRSSRVRLHA